MIVGRGDGKTPMIILDTLPNSDGRHCIVAADITRDGVSGVTLYMSRELHDQLVEWTTLVL